MLKLSMSNQPRELFGIGENVTKQTFTYKLTSLRIFSLKNTIAMTQFRNYGIALRKIFSYFWKLMFQLKKTTNNSKHQCWITEKVKKQCRKKKRWYKKMKKSNSNRAKTKYLDIKKQCQNECRKAKSDYINNLCTQENNKAFWKYIKNKGQDSNHCSFLKVDGKLFSEATDKVEILNKQFTSVFSPPIGKQIHMKSPPKPHIPEIKVTTNGVQKLMENLKPFKATGPDGVPPMILKELAPQLAPVFTILFQASINQSTIPSDWKLAHVTPVFKKGDSQRAENYRPVSLTSVPCKLLEHIIHAHIMNHLEKHDTLCDNQHGFRKRRSCESQLISTIDNLAKNLDNGFQTDVILLDFSKAFDKVNHSSLIKKMEHYGVKGNILKWTNDFLSNRTQRVALDGHLSNPSCVQSGVPQGTVLGPLLFLIYINDLPEFTSSGTNVSLFADDSALYRKIITPEDHLILQQDLDSLQKWEIEWDMEFHPGKCQLLQITKKKKPSFFTYNIHGSDIEKVDSAKYLGITISSDLSWNTHISNICKKSNNTINFLHRNFKSCPPKIKANLFKTYVRPPLEYCAPVWDPHTQNGIESLEKVQKRAARFVNNKYSREERVTPMLHDLGWQPLNERRAKAKTTVLYKAINNHIDLSTQHLVMTQGCTRGCNNYFIPYARTDTYRHSFFLSSTRLWNKIPQDIRSLPDVSSFQKGLTNVNLTNSSY